MTTSLVTYTTAQQSLDSDCRQRTAEQDDDAPSVSTACTEITVVPCGGIPKMFKELFADDNERGVSPVIGVILMVAITVILAAVIGAFVLGLGDQVSETAPTATIDYEFDNADGVTLSHEGGAELDNSTISININGSVAPTTGWDGNDDDMISAGDTITLESSSAPYGDVESDDFASGNTVRVIWQGDSGSSSTIASRDFP